MIIAILTLFYGIHREQLNQANQTMRLSGFELLKAANQLQTLVHESHYDKENEAVHYEGWSKILFINDMSVFVEPQVVRHAKELTVYWQRLNKNFKSKRNLKDFIHQLNKTRAATKKAISSLS